MQTTLVVLVAILGSAAAFVPAQTGLLSTTNPLRLQLSRVSSESMPIVGLIVEATVKDDKMDEFLRLIEADAVGSRNEPGCLRFGACVIAFITPFILSLLFMSLTWLNFGPDVVQSQDSANKFVFYELYTDEDALAYHNKQPYFDDIVKFVTEGGAEIVINKATGKFMTE